MTRTQTVGLFSLECACGRKVHVLDVLERTQTGRETVRHYCHTCKCLSWWLRTPGRPEKVMLIDREEYDPACKCWPPTGWTRRHLPSRRR